MKTSEKGCLLRIYLGEREVHRGRPLYEKIVTTARELGLAGATVLRGPMGYGAGSQIHTAKLLRLSEDLPVVIEIVDSREKVEQMLPHLDEMMHDGLVTMEQVEVIWYRQKTLQEV
jgi:PII-like signaling protein